jgi:DNA gyrase/topoisomerase IV subunit B
MCDADVDGIFFNPYLFFRFMKELIEEGTYISPLAIIFS